MLKDKQIKSRFLAKQIEVSKPLYFNTFIILDSSHCFCQMHYSDILELDCPYRDSR